MVEIENGQKYWDFCSKQYVEAEVQNLLACLKKIGEGLAA